MESQKSLYVHLVMLANDLLLLAGQHKGGKPREVDRYSKHWLKTEGGTRVCPVPLGYTSMQHSKHSFPVGR